MKTDFFVLFSEYLSSQKANSNNTRESYLRDAMNYLTFLSELDVSPLWSVLLQLFHATLPLSDAFINS